MTMNKQELYAVPVPKPTSTYAPVSHKNVIEAAHEQLYKHNFTVKNEMNNAQRFGQQLIGYMDIEHPSSSNMGMRLAYRNSYDKSMSLAFVAGTAVWICGNGMISGEIQFVRKHTGGVLQEMNERVVYAINELESHFDKMLSHSATMKNIHLDLTEAAKLAGTMFIEESLISPTQLNEVKRQLLHPTYKDFEEENLWSFYNHVTYSLKESHPTTYLQQHKKVHEFIEDEFQLV